MDRLKGKTILIGRDPVTSKLLISVNINGHKKEAVINSNNISSSVSRCLPDQNMAHCKIVINQNGDMVITNLKEQNITKVNGDDIISKRITKASNISLGKEGCQFSVETIIEAAKKLVPSLPARPKSIKHLEKVYEDYEKTLDKIYHLQEKKRKMTMLPIIVASFGGVLTAVLTIFEIYMILWVSIPITVVPFLLHIRNFTKKDTSYEDKKKAQNKLIEEYVCPHCYHYIEYQPYKVLKQNKTCPYCKGEWIS